MDKKEIRKHFIESIKRINKEMGKDSMFPRSTPTYRNYSEDIRDGYYKDKSLEELKSGLLKDFEDDYMRDMFPDKVKKQLKSENERAIAKGKAMKNPPPNTEKGGERVVVSKEKRNRQAPLSNYK